MRTLNLLSLLFLFVFFNCSKTIDTNYLKGYWEIESVQTNTSEKQYSYNKNIDFYSLNENVGFKKKLSVTFNDKYLSNSIQIPFEIKIDNGKTFLYFNKNNNKWKEEILKLDAEELKIENENNIIYTYKRHEPIKLD